MPNLIGGIVLGYIWNLLINGVLAHFGVDITFAEIEHGLTSFSELEKQLAARGVVLERENESDTG